MRALVTGATGFVGSHLARRLAQDGWETHLLCARATNLNRLHDIASEMTVHLYDGAMDSMATIVERARPDVVFHLASLFLVEHGPDAVDELIRTNILLGTQLAEAMAAQGRTRLVNTGTSWQHFENRPYAPVNLYAATKQAFEDILAFFVERFRFTCLTLKLFDTYGRHDFRPKLFHLLEKAARSGGSLALSPGGQLIDLVHIDDVVEAYLVAAQRVLAGEPGRQESFAVSSGAPRTLREVVALYQQATKRQLRIEWGGKPYREREVMTPWSAYAPLPGWTPRIPLAEGFAASFGPAGGNGPL